MAHICACGHSQFLPVSRESVFIVFAFACFLFPFRNMEFRVPPLQPTSARATLQIQTRNSTRLSRFQDSTFLNHVSLTLTQHRARSEQNTTLFLPSCFSLPRPRTRTTMLRAHVHVFLRLRGFYIHMLILCFNIAVRNRGDTHHCYCRSDRTFGQTTTTDSPPWRDPHP